ncbi:unnamed protein product [Tuber melanosporum]|uniref:(Perigord truffle) hypothetical protein n=1 Tax=Tuber melanosporum (strain Mel28) TaxID=656061 RepID=D5GEC2_TUBMM|nr:uncharacterized protein GSTUM_00001262001 [Tuber melanosporum]CAZ82865.1 unnamed protein product [Tuber melanosporum]
MPVDLCDETIQDFIDIWENMELDLSLVSMSPDIPPASRSKGGDLYRGVPKVKFSTQELGMNVGWERGKKEEPALYLQLQTSFRRQDVRGDERWSTQGNDEGSSLYSLTSVSSDDSETMVLTPYIVSSPTSSGLGACQSLSFGGEGSLSSSASTTPDYELSPVNLSPVPEALHPPHLFRDFGNTSAPALVTQESLLYPAVTRAPPGPTTPFQLASVPEIAHQRSHSSAGTTGHPSPWDSYFENPRARPVTPARKAVSTPSSPVRLRAAWSLVTNSLTTGVGGSPTSPPPRSRGSTSTPCVPVLARRAAKILGVGSPPTSTLPHGLRSYSSNLSTASSSPTLLSRGHSSTASSSCSSRSSASTPRSPVAYDPTLDCATLTTALNQYTKTRKIPYLLNKTAAKIALQPSNLPDLDRAFSSLPSNQGICLSTKIRTQTTGPHRLLLLKLLSGPHRGEAEWLSTYCCPLGPRHTRTQIPPDDKLLAEIIFGKSPRELRLLKDTFAELNNGWNIRDALAELYPVGTTGAAFGRAASRLMKCDRDEEDEILGAKRGEEIVAHVEDLYAVGEGGGGVKYLDQRLLLEVVIRRSDGFLRDLCSRFRERHARELVDVVAARERVVVGKGGAWPNNLVRLLIFFAFTSAFLLTGAGVRYYSRT